MRREIKVTGLVAAGGKTKSGQAIFVKARAILALTIISTLTPYAFVCDYRCAPCYFVLVGSETNYNQCYPYMVSKFGKIKDCGAGPVVKVYLRGRFVGECREGSPESSKWLKAAQYYVVKPGGRGEDSPPEGPP